MADLVSTIQEPGWRASLALQFEQRTGDGCRLTGVTHRGPLRVQRPFYPEGPHLPHLYLLHPPGGLVTGDELTIDVETGSSAHALLTTPGAGRVYRARQGADGLGGQDKGADGNSADGNGANRGGGWQRQHVALKVGSGGGLEWLPQETIVFDGARFRQSLVIDLAADAGLIAWEICCLGRRAGDRPFVNGVAQQQWRIDRAGRPLLRERLTLGGAGPERTAPWGLRGHSVLGMLVAMAPHADTATIQAAVDALRSGVTEAAAERSIAITAPRGLIIVRYLGDEGERAKALFELAWRILRPFVAQRSACRPRIWNT